MAEKVELVVTIGADGVVRVKTHGLKGQACLLETRDLEASLGRVRSREKTGEFYETPAQTRAGIKNR